MRDETTQWTELQGQFRLQQQFLYGRGRLLQLRVLRRMSELCAIGKSRDLQQYRRQRNSARQYDLRGRKQRLWQHREVQRQWSLSTCKRGFDLWRGRLCPAGVRVRERYDGVGIVGENPGADVQWKRNVHFCGRRLLWEFSVRRQQGRLQDELRQ